LVKTFFRLKATFKIYKYKVIEQNQDIIYHYPMAAIHYHNCKKQMEIIGTKELIKKRLALLLKELDKKRRYCTIMKTSVDIQRIGIILQKRKLMFE
jgi:hypothetical protein